MLMAAHLSRELGWIEPELYTRVHKMIVRSRVPLVPPQGMTPDDFKRLFTLDKKVEAGKTKFILMKGELGKVVITSDFD